MLRCPSCRAQQYALYICDDSVHRCWSCKSVRRPTPPAPVQPYQSPNITRREPGVTLAAIERKLRSKIADIELRPDWRHSESLSSAHFAYTEAVQIVKGARK